MLNHQIYGSSKNHLKALIKGFFIILRSEYILNGQWSMVNGQWSMVNGQWSKTSKNISNIQLRLLPYNLPLLVISTTPHPHFRPLLQDLGYFDCKITPQVFMGSV